MKKKNSTLVVKIILAASSVIIFGTVSLLPKSNLSLDTQSLKFIISEAIPGVKATGTVSANYVESNIFSYFMGFNLQNPLTILESQIKSYVTPTAQPVIEAYLEPAQEVVTEEALLPPLEFVEPTPDPEITTGPIKDITVNPAKPEGYVNYKDIYISNETTYDVDIDKLLNEPPNFSFDKEGPQVLIIHAHTSEAYLPTKENFYVPSDTDRTEDIRFNVARVGDEIARVLTESGIEVIHDSEINDYPSYNGSYKKALGSTESYLKKYPSIKVVLDIHRDSMINKQGEVMKVTSTINGEKAAQIMFVVGTNQGGLSHSKWKENLKLALKMQAQIKLDYPTLARPLNLRKERFNQHATPGSMIIEMGSSGNTLEEALLGAKYMATSISKVLNNIPKE